MISNILIRKRLVNVAMIAGMALLPCAHAVTNLSIGLGPDTPDGSYLNAVGLSDTLAFTTLIIQADNSITFVDPVSFANSLFFGPTTYGVTLQSATINVSNPVIMSPGNFILQAPSVNLNAGITNAGGTLIASPQLSGTATQVAVLSPNASIQQGIAIANTASLANVAVSSGAYAQNIALNKSTVTLGLGNIVLNGNLNVDAGSFNTGGGSLNVSNLTLGSTAGGNGSHIQANGTVTVNDTLSLGLVSGSAGTYNLQGGTLIAQTIDAANMGTSSFNFGGGTLAVDTFIGDLVNNGGLLSPGSSPSTTTVQGDFSQSALGTLMIEIGGTNAGQFDLLNVTGTAALGGELEVAFWNGFIAALGDSFDILTAQDLLGDFDYYSLPTLSDGLLWDVSKLYDQGAAGTDYLRLNVLAVPSQGVPEPSTLPLLALGAFAGAMIRRCRA